MGRQHCPVVCEAGEHHPAAALRRLRCQASGKMNAARLIEISILAHVHEFPGRMQAVDALCFICIQKLVDRNDRNHNFALIITDLSRSSEAVSIDRWYSISNTTLPRLLHGF